MNELRFWNKLTLLTLGRLCQQRMLLAGVALLCFLLPIFIAPAAEFALSQGISFSGITLAITGPENDSVPQQLEQILPNMSDISQYCQVDAMEYAEAVRSLEREEVTAVLVLPENFIQGVMNGSNPDVELIVRGDRPLEALLTLWVGQSASDMLAAIQSGIYAVLELYAENPPEGLSHQDVVTDINLRYISWTMNRQEMFHIQTVSATGQLPVGLHYGLSLLSYLVLSLAPFFAAVYEAGWISAQRRFRAAGRGTGIFYLSALTACWIVVFLLLFAAQLMAVPGNAAERLASSALCGLFCAAFGSLCCLVTPDTGSCGVLSFSGSLLFLALSGGIVPPVLMPGALRDWIAFSPVTWLRNVLAMPAGEYDLQPGMVAALAVSSAVMIGAGALLYGYRGKREVTGV